MSAANRLQRYSIYESRRPVMMQSTSPVTTPAVSNLLILSKNTNLKITHILMGSQDSSAGIVTRMWTGRSWVQFSAVDGDSALSATQRHIKWSQWVKWPRCIVDF